MKTYNFPAEQLCSLKNINSGWASDEVSHLWEYIYAHKYRVNLSCSFWQTLNKLHVDIFPRSMWYYSGWCIPIFFLLPLARPMLTSTHGAFGTSRGWYIPAFFLLPIASWQTQHSSQILTTLVFIWGHKYLSQRRARILSRPWNMPKWSCHKGEGPWNMPKRSRCSSFDWTVN